HVPEPDFMVLRGTLESYEDLPFASDAFCIVEVADASYERDGSIKLEGYARASVAQFIIINLRNRTAEVRTNPDVASEEYPDPQIITEDSELKLRVGESEYFSVQLKTVLP